MTDPGNQSRSGAGKGSLQEALEISESVWAKAPFFLAGAGLLAGVLMKLGNVPRAEELLRKIPRDEPNQAGLYFYHLVCGDADAAPEALEAIIDLQGTIHAASFRIGQALLPGPGWARVAKRINLPL